MIYQLPANIHTAAACLLWSGKFDDPEDSKRNDRLKRRVKIAVLFSNLLQTLCIAALTYFVLSGGQRPQHASKWIFQVPESKEVSVVFFLAFVIAGVVLIRKEQIPAHAAQHCIYHSWFPNTNRSRIAPRIWFFLIVKFPVYLAETGGYTYMAAFCIRFNAFGEAPEYLEYVLNLLAFELVFLIDDWIFEIMAPRWRMAGVWNDKNLTVSTRAYDRIMSHTRWCTALTLTFIGFCVCSRITFVVAIFGCIKGFAHAAFNSWRHGSLMYFYEWRGRLKRLSRKIQPWSGCALSP